MHRTDKYSQHSSIIWPVWLNGWVFVYELSGCGFESRCCRFIFHITYYLSMALYFLIINTSYSRPSNLLCGIPQGSILSLLLLLLCINDLPEDTGSDSLFYADNTWIVFQRKNLFHDFFLFKSFLNYLLLTVFMQNTLSKLVELLQ